MLDFSRGFLTVQLTSVDLGLPDSFHFGRRFGVVDSWFFFSQVFLTLMVREVYFWMGV